MYKLILNQLNLDKLNLNLAMPQPHPPKLLKVLLQRKSRKGAMLLLLLIMIQRVLMNLEMKKLRKFYKI